MGRDSLTQDMQATNVFCTVPLHEELAILGGQTRVLSRKTKHKVSRSSTPASSPDANASSYASATSSTQKTTSTSSSRDMEEIYKDFVGYLSDLSVASTPACPGVVSSHHQSPTQVDQTSEFQQLSSNNAFTPSVINQAYDTLNQQLTSSPSNWYIAGVDAYSMDMSGWMASVPMSLDEGSYQRQIDPFNLQDHTTSYPESNHFLGVAPSTQCQDPAEHLVEMGLTSESGMDEGWLSFMQECGIMDQGKPYV